MGLMQKSFDNAYELNNKNILGCLEHNPDAVSLDVGCDDGSWTMRLVEKIGTKNIHGIELIDDRADMAEQKGVQVKKSDLNSKFPYPDAFFDVVHANQVIEHISNSDNFLDEISRVLKPGGYSIISTENASSWHNIAASILGWQIFSLTNITMKRSGVGNPLALYRNVVPDQHLSSWVHARIYNFRGLKELLELFDMSVEKIVGAGYHPFPASFGRIDPRHAHFMTFKARKRQSQ
jgi:ubiquinone/menaquinone biosynthesis C-methylase UbiE